MRLRSHLFLLVVIAVVPVVLFAAMLLTAFAQGQARALEQGARETASALTVAVRREIDEVVASLEALAESLALDGMNLDGFRAQAERIRQQHGGWQRLVLADAAGSVLIDTGGALPQDVSLGDRSYFQEAVRQGRPLLSDLIIGRISNRAIIAIAVPVRRDGAIRYVLVAAVDPNALVEPLATFHLAIGQAFRVFDRNRTTVARFPPDRSVVGAEAGPLFAAMQGGGRDDWVRFVARTGQALYGATVALPEYGWLATFTLPASEIDGPWRMSLLLVAAGGLFLVAFGLVAAVVLGRRIERPMAFLARQAEAVGHGEPIEFRHSGITEVNDIGAALSTASRLLADRAEERARYESALAARAEELTRADRVKDEFLATLSHELRSPLNAIVGWTRMLKLGAAADPAAQARALETIERNAHLQEQLIGDLLDVSRIVTGRLRLETRPVQVPTLVEAALDVVRPAAEAKGVRLGVELAARCATVLGDANRLQQVLWNLLSNAVKFTPRGGQVVLRTRNVNSHLEISVADTGEGIAPEFLPLVFERFRQADGALNRQHGGLGLGLSIVRNIIELHGGSIRAASDGPGRGATFTVDLPTLAVLPAAEARPAGAPVDAAAAPLRNMRVLVVEDDRDSLELIAAVLARAGAFPVQAASAAEAWSALAGDAYHVLVCDISMPGEDGYSLIRRIRAAGDPQFSHLPAAALTAQARPEDRTRALLNGFQAHIPKPVHADELVATVAMLAGRADLLHIAG